MYKTLNNYNNIYNPKEKSNLKTTTCDASCAKNYCSGKTTDNACCPEQPNAPACADPTNLSYTACSGHAGGDYCGTNGCWSWDGKKCNQDTPQLLISTGVPCMAGTKGACDDNLSEYSCPLGSYTSKEKCINDQYPPPTCPTYDACTWEKTTTSSYKTHTCQYPQTNNTLTSPIPSAETGPHFVQNNSNHWYITANNQSSNYIKFLGYWASEDCTTTNTSPNINKYNNCPKGSTSGECCPPTFFGRGNWRKDNDVLWQIVPVNESPGKGETGTVIYNNMQVGLLNKTTGTYLTDLGYGQESLIGGSGYNLMPWVGTVTNKGGVYASQKFTINILADCCTSNSDCNSGAYTCCDCTNIYFPDKHLQALTEGASFSLQAETVGKQVGRYIQCYNDDSVQPNGDAGHLRIQNSANSAPSGCKSFSDDSICDMPTC